MTTSVAALKACATPNAWKVTTWLGRSKTLRSSGSSPKQNDKVWGAMQTGEEKVTPRHHCPTRGRANSSRPPRGRLAAGRSIRSATPRNGHLFGHPVPPIIAKEDAAGVVAGTTSHFSKAFPQVKVELEGGQVVKVLGGAAYGEAWRNLLEESRRTQYPCFPRPGLFYLWVAAIGTNPKIMRPSGIEKHSSGGFEWERRRSGVIHMGFGTLWRSKEEKWAGENGILYGHLHIHLLFPTFTITAKNGKKYTIIRDGRLTALDDPEVRKLAEEEGAEVVVISAQVEAELAELDAADRTEFLAGLGLERSGLERLIARAYDLLGLLTFFTAGPKEARAWTVPAGSTAPRAAREVHSDMERGFIRAEVISFEDYDALGSEAAAREAGRLRVEGKEYVVKDGDVIHFRFNV